MKSEEFAKVCFALRPVLVVAAVAVGGVVLIHAWGRVQRQRQQQQLRNSPA